MAALIGELFDPKAPLAISEHSRPHWSQAGAIVFITFRSADSIPRDVLLRWERKKNQWIESHSELALPWRKALPHLSSQLQNAFKKQFDRTREDFLDTCRGKCVLKKRTLAKIVADSLLYFDGERYRMGDFVVMPNHVHLLASFPSEESLTVQCDSWLHFTAHKINLELGLTGKFWQQEPFDHLVRSPEQYNYLRKYIKENGVKAGVREGEYLYRRCES
ncbi:transposase [Neorhodopirellula lusitana]|uniref:transposase n=1 Tax=Neorhodopirellula lusitana TaxID=445327 RepID=UPI00384D0CBB